MTAYININQQAFVEISEEKNINLDTVDASIFSYILQFSNSPKIKKKLIEDKVFYWFSYQKIIDDNPLFRIKCKRNIERRLQKLIDCNILEKKIFEEEGNKTYFHITQEAFEKLIEKKQNSNKKEEGYVLKSTKGMYSKVQ